ncbi:MAG: hypothetical protein Q8R60_09825 [Mycobacteriales bacterium]|nr:hypothetical protein [Mycobacteriales bacterium]
MTPADDLPFVSVAAAPVARASDLRQASRVARSYQISPGPLRTVQAQAMLDDLAQEWSLPTFRARRWLAAADVLTGPSPLEMYVQIDYITNLFTLELWAYGRVVFGIDDWLGL